MTPPVAGRHLPVVQRDITAELVRRYADASGDHNPIHLDPDVAARSPFGGVVAHGMLLLAYVAESLARAFGPSWAESGELRVRFRTPVLLGERVAASGRVERAEEQADGALLVCCSVWCGASGQEPAITGEATVRYRER